mmetsp:Transcript_30037/g.60107  ORF Transcript_30037/g.60107 Transcript_30037/m.60107 type:complete len:420 (+) Transcript_30037:111-1370(+)
MRRLLSRSWDHYHLAYLLFWHLFLFVTSLGTDISAEGPEVDLNSNNAASGVDSETKPVGECGVPTPSIPLQSSFSSFVDDSRYLSRKPQEGDIVTFTLHRFEPTTKAGMRKIPADLDLPFDTFGTLQLELYGGNYLPELHDVLSDMTPEETLQGVIIDPRRGEWDHRMEYKLPAAKMGTSLDSLNVSVGATMRLKGGKKCTITDMTGDFWICDGNDPLAGVVFEVDVTLEGVEEGPSLGWEFSEGNGTATGEKYQVATFALGCFWGGELAYQRVPGVISTRVGYTQGDTLNPTYKQVSSGNSGHTEAIQVIYDPSKVTYKSLVQLGLNRLGDNIYILNQVGNDRGTQYRHGIYYHNNMQRKIAEEILLEYGSRNDKREVMTELKAASSFYIAEEYHQQYLMKGGQSAKKDAEETIRCYG